MTEPKYILRLYIAGQSARSIAAVSTLRRLCEDSALNNYTLEIIDVIERPDLAENEQIMATPTLIKEIPPPLQRVIGDLSDETKVLIGLDLRRVGHETPRQGGKVP